MVVHQHSNLPLSELKCKLKKKELLFQSFLLQKQAAHPPKQKHPPIVITTILHTIDEDDELDSRLSSNMIDPIINTTIAIHHKIELHKLLLKLI